MTAHELIAKIIAEGCCDEDLEQCRLAATAILEALKAERIWLCRDATDEERCSPQFAGLPRDMDWLTPLTVDEVGGP